MLLFGILNKIQLINYLKYLTKLFINFKYFKTLKKLYI